MYFKALAVIALLAIALAYPVADKSDEEIEAILDELFGSLLDPEVASGPTNQTDAKANSDPRSQSEDIDGEDNDDEELETVLHELFEFFDRANKILDTVKDDDDIDAIIEEIFGNTSNPTETLDSEGKKEDSPATEHQNEDGQGTEMLNEASIVPEGKDAGKKLAEDIKALDNEVYHKDEEQMTVAQV